MNLVRGIYALVTELASQWKDTSSDLAKIEGTIYYIKGIELARRLAIAFYFLVGSFLVLIFGLLMIHITLLILIPFSLAWRLYAAFALIMFDLSLAIGIALILFSQKNWLKFSKSTELIENIVAKGAPHQEEL